jgi:osmotically-inducible protein OsmY
MTTAPMERADEQIQRDVLEELKWDAFVPIEKLEITVSKGWVTLKGDVEWEYQRRTAERAVRRLAGAGGVTNLITVRPRIAPEPSDLKRRIEEALVRSTETDAERVNVDVIGDKGDPRRQGRGWSGKRPRGVAWSAPGFSTVDNRIIVSP